MKGQSWILLVLAGLVLIAFGSGRALNLFSGVGFTSLALSQVQFTSNDPVLGGQAWILTVSQNGAQQSAFGTFTATDSSQQKSSNQFTITTSLDANTANYQILNQYRLVRHVEWTQILANPFSSSLGCDTSIWTNWRKPSASFSAWCWKYTTDGYYGTVASPTNVFQTTISMQSSAGTDKCVINSASAQSCNFQNGNGYVLWAGNLVSGQSLPQPSDQNIVAVYDTRVFSNGWKTADSLAYITWSNYDTGFDACTDSDTDGHCFRNYNSYEQTFLAGKPFYFYSASGAPIAATTAGMPANGQVTLNLPVQVQFPVLTMHVKAAFLGTNVAVGMPRIISVSSLPFSTGSTGFIVMQLQNTGTGAGSFNYYVTCQSPLSQVGTSATVSVQPQETVTVNVPITDNTATDTTASCTATVRDLNNPSNTDSRSVAVTVKALLVCSSGDKRINGNLIEACQNNAWTTLQDCSKTGQVAAYVNNQPACVSNAASNVAFACAPFDIGCQINAWWQQQVGGVVAAGYGFLLAVIVIALIAVFLFGSRFRG